MATESPATAFPLTEFPLDFRIAGTVAAQARLIRAAFCELFFRGPGAGKAQPCVIL